MKLQSTLPLASLDTGVVEDGLSTSISSYCRRKLDESDACASFYLTLRNQPEGFYQCPFGFTSRTFFVSGEAWAITGMVAHPRFGNGSETQRAKESPDHRISRQAVDRTANVIMTIENARADAVQAAAQVLPQAFHELRKLNAAVLQHSEREIKDRGESKSLLSIRSAAELMRNNFEILEALANIDVLKTLPNDSTINLFDLLFKMKRVYGEKAAQKDISILVDGVRAIISGSQKSFPIVSAVLLENAIKYGLKGSRIRVEVRAANRMATFIIENATDHHIDPGTCFNRGARFAPEVEGGGFGLFLAREVVQCHGGLIRCEAGLGMVRMIVDLPLKAVIDQR